MNCPYCGGLTVREEVTSILSQFLEGDAHKRFCPQCKKKWRARKRNSKVLGRDVLLVVLFTAMGLMVFHFISSMDLTGRGKSDSKLTASQNLERLEGYKKKFESQSRYGANSQKAEALKALQQMQQ